MKILWKYYEKDGSSHVPGSCDNTSRAINRLKLKLVHTLTLTKLHPNSEQADILLTQVKTHMSTFWLVNIFHCYIL